MDNDITNNTKEELAIISINVTSTLNDKLIPDSTILKSSSSSSSSLSKDLIVSSNTIKGALVIPRDTKGIVLFAHGSGSGRNSPRNQLISRTLNKSGIATLLLDLLTEQEEKVDLQTKELRFNIPLLVERLITAIDFVSFEKETRNLI